MSIVCIALQDITNRKDEYSDISFLFFILAAQLVVKNVSKSYFTFTYNFLFKLLLFNSIPLLHRPRTNWKKVGKKRHYLKRKKA